MSLFTRRWMINVALALLVAPPPSRWAPANRQTPGAPPLREVEQFAGGHAALTRACRDGTRPRFCWRLLLRHGIRSLSMVAEGVPGHG